MLKPKESSCRIFLEKLLSPPPCDPFFCFVAKFFRIFRKYVEVFFSMKLAVKNFRHFLKIFYIGKILKIFYRWIHWKKCRKFFTLSINFIEKKIRHSFGKFETIWPQTKNMGHRGELVQKKLFFVFQIIIITKISILFLCWFSFELDEVSVGRGYAVYSHMCLLLLFLFWKK